MTRGFTDSTEVPNVFVAATQWIQAVLLGPAATAIAVVAVASIGLLMLSGRMNIRRAGTALIGCFILFGAATIAQGLRGGIAVLTNDGLSGRAVATQQPASMLLPPPAASSPSDPYAGASVRR